MLKGMRDANRAVSHIAPVSEAAHFEIVPNGVARLLAVVNKYCLASSLAQCFDPDAAASLVQDQRSGFGTLPHPWSKVYGREASLLY